MQHPKRTFRAQLDWAAQWDRYWSAGGEEQPATPICPELQADCAFIVQHWHRISQAEAARRLPGMGYAGAYFFRCDAFDEETSLCTAHEERPPICRDFPWYGKAVGTSRLHSAFRRCTYWADVPSEQWPEQVAPQTLIQVQRKSDALASQT